MESLMKVSQATRTESSIDLTAPALAPRARSCGLQLLSHTVAYARDGGLRCAMPPQIPLVKCRLTTTRWYIGFLHDRAETTIFAIVIFTGRELSL